MLRNTIVIVRITPEMLKRNGFRGIEYRQGCCTSYKGKLYGNIYSHRDCFRY